MAGRRTTDSNESFQTVPVFETDPHGAAMFAGVVAGTQTIGGRPVIDAQRSRWFGWTAPPQQLRGAGNLGGRPVVPAGTTLDQERGDNGAAPDAIQSLFQERMTARRFGS